MGVDHLQGKRTGRPRGAKTPPPWVRAARWAYEHLDVADAVPPSALAARLVALGRKHPDRLAVCLARLDAMGHRTDRRNRGGNDARANGAGQTVGGILDDGQPRRLKQVTIREMDLFSPARHDSRVCVQNPPCGAHVVGCEVDTSRRRIHFFIRSEDFEVVEEGNPIPELPSEHVRDWR